MERGWMTATRRTPQSQHNRSVSGRRSLYGPTRFDRSPHDESSESSCLERDERMTATRRTPQSQHNRSISGQCSLYGLTQFDRSPRDESSASSCLERDERFTGASRLIRCTCHRHSSLGHLSLITTMFLFTTLD